ncbi:MAG: PAS domain S-box protein, partial [Pseudomonadales bacterium]|nr:PAS domain S-box protein [Pseudomonadales bacterium]
YTNNIRIKPENSHHIVFLKKQNPPQNLVEYLFESKLVQRNTELLSPNEQTQTTLSTSQYHAIFSSISDAIISLDAEGRVSFLNNSAENLLEIKVGQAQGHDIRALLDLQDPQSKTPLIEHVLQKSMYQGFADHLQPRHDPSFQALLLSPSGKQHKVSIKANRYFSPTHGIDEIIVIKNLTNKYDAENELRERERKYWSLINTTHLGYCILDQRGKVVDANDEFLRITGFNNLEAILGSPAISCLPDYEKQRFLRKSKQLMQHGKLIGFEVDFQSSRGKITPTEFSASVLNENDEIRIIGIGRDISQRRQNEKEKGHIQTQLRQAQKMEAIGQLTGGIAHDFNNILASILGYAELAQHLSNMADQDPFLNIKPFNKKLHSYLDAIHDSGTRARDLVKQLLIFSRGEDIDPQAIKAEPTIQEILKLLSSTLPKSIKVSTLFEENLPAISIAPIQLHQVIMNLCINARDALNESGNIEVSASRRNNFAAQCASCHEGFHGDFVELLIKDNGSGIDSQHLNRIFEPFYTTKDIGQGTGMGLPIVHGIVHEHDGHITIDSSPKKGTAIAILLPVSNEKPQILSEPALEAAPANEILPATGLSNGHIVVIDDEESLTQFLSDLLTTQGYKVTAFTDSLKAKKELPSIIGSVDLVLTDHTMPGITGSQLAQHLLELKPDLPIILCTGFSFSMDEKTAYRIGIRRFLQKPLSTQTLLKEIKALIKTSTSV